MESGWHQKTISEVRQLCVDSFTSSRTRDAIMTGLEFVYNKLTTNLLSLEIWIDGSFVTEKINPEDCDIVLCVQWGVYQQWTFEQKGIIDWVAGDDLRTLYYCHSFVFFEYSESHPCYAKGVWNRAYWIRQYGFSRENDYKGIAVIKI